MDGHKKLLCNTITNGYKNAYAPKLATNLLRNPFLSIYFNTTANTAANSFFVIPAGKKRLVLILPTLYINPAAFAWYKEANHHYILSNYPWKGNTTLTVK